MVRTGGDDVRSLDPAPSARRDRCGGRSDIDIEGTANDPLGVETGLHGRSQDPVGSEEVMKPANEDLQHRRPVWGALSGLFLDTDTSLARVWRIETLAASPYSMDELQEILVDEVYPVCRPNLFTIAGEWAGFDPEWLETRILRRLRPTFHPWQRFSLGRLTVHLSLEWRQTRAGVIRLRSSGNAEATHGQT
jgi:hypothetical protein